MKIAVVGTGAMGSVYAGLFAAAGHEVWAIDRWREHVEAMRSKGLRVEGASGGGAAAGLRGKVPLCFGISCVSVFAGVRVVFVGQMST